MLVLQSIIELAVALLLWATLFVAALTPAVLLVALWVMHQKQRRTEDDDDISNGGGWNNNPTNRPTGGGPDKCRTIEEVLMDAIGTRAPVEVEMPEEVCV